MKLNIASRIFVAGLLSLFAPIAHAQVPPTAKAQAIYSHLLNDFYDEVSSMDAVTEAQDERAAFVARMKAYVEAQTTGTRGEVANPTLEPGKSWSNLLPVQPIQLNGTNSSAARHQTKTFSGRALHENEPHALSDIPQYVQQRLGAAASNDLTSKRIDALAYGGTIESALRFVGAREAYEVPSFYRAWGIKKYLVLDAKEKKPLLIYVIPPSTEYSKHYSMMFSAIHAKASSVLDLDDRVQAQKEFQAALDDVLEQLRSPKIDFVSLGYSDQWAQALQATKQPGDQFTLSDEVVSVKNGIRARLLFVQENGKNPVQILTLKSDQTIWGESSAFVAEAALSLNPKGFLFFGSAGGLSDKANVYDVSVPVSFSTEHGGVNIPNILQTHSGEIAANSHIHFDIHHGHSNSPLEQTLGYIKKLEKKGIDTVDVEESLIARTIARYNKEHHTQIAFGAANVVTDKPGQVLSQSTSKFNLDNIHAQAKAQARLWVLETAIDSVETVMTPSRPACRKSAL